MASSSITLIMKGLLQCKVLALGNAPIFLIKYCFFEIVFCILGLLVIIIHLKKIKELSNCRFFI